MPLPLGPASHQTRAKNRARESEEPFHHEAVDRRERRASERCQHARPTLGLQCVGSVRGRVAAHPLHDGLVRRVTRGGAPRAPGAAAVAGVAAAACALDAFGVAAAAVDADELVCRTSVVDLAAASVRASGVFVLDQGSRLILWPGPASSSRARSSRAAPRALYLHIFGNASQYSTSK